MKRPPRFSARAVASIAVALTAAIAVGYGVGRMSAEPAAGEHAVPGAAGTITARLVEPTSRCERADRPLTLAQDLSEPGPGLVATWFEHEQALAQTFTSPAAGLQLVEVAPTFSYATGTGATVSIHAVAHARDPMSGRELVRAELDSLAIPSGEAAVIALDDPLPIECGAIYSIVIRPKPNSELSVQATTFTGAGNVYRDGAMFMGRPGRWEPTGGEMRFEVTFEPISGA
jgi:hypothetical protein